jgi:hypothetical protein
VKKLVPQADISLSMDDLPLAKGAGLAFTMDCDSSRAHDLFGFDARHSMEAGVYRTLNTNRIFAGMPPIPEPAEARLAGV